MAGFGMEIKKMNQELKSSINMGKTRINQYMGKGKDHKNPVEGGKAR